MSAPIPPTVCSCVPRATTPRYHHHQPHHNKQARKLELCSDSFGLCQRAQPPGQSSTLLRNPSSSGVSTASISSSARPPRSAGTSGGGGGGGGFQPTTPLTPFPGGPLASAASAATQQSHHTHGGARGVAVMSPYSDIPQSPSLTYEDIVYQPKGRYVLG